MTELDKYRVIRCKSLRRVTILKIVNLIAFLLIIFSNNAFTQKLHINDMEYFETRGLNVMVFSREYDGFFFDEKTSGIELIHHGVRTATGGAIRLQNTPEQWDMIPKMVERNVRKSENSIEVVLRYDEYDFNSRIEVTSKGDGFIISVVLDKPVPELLEGKAGLNFEFLPSSYFERTYLVDGKPGIFPLHPSGKTIVEPVSEKIPQFAGHTTFDDRGYGVYLVPQPIVSGNNIVLAPDDPERHVIIQSESELMLFDGRMLAQNGWFVVRSILPANKTGKVLEWYVQPNTVPDWIREPVIGFSQVGYHPQQKKVAVIELDKYDTPLEKATLYQVTANGQRLEKHRAGVQVWGNYLRYNYLEFDFSEVKTPGVYYIQYGNTSTNSFIIDNNVYEKVWHPTMDVFFPVQMDHMTVNEAYRTWHGVSFLDDALQAPVNVQHFDGYRMDSVTDTRFEPYERIPGLAVGGWYDAGDFDIQTGTHCRTILSFVNIWEYFGMDRDQTYINQETRYVDIHRPDGKPDLLQQIEHGVLNLAAQVENIGHPVRGIVVPNLHQYHHLGDASTSTDNLPYNPDLKSFESDGKSSGTMDDRWVFTNRNTMLDFYTSAALTAASRALAEYNKDLSERCITLAVQLYDEAVELSRITVDTEQSRWGRFAEVTAALQLYISTKTQKYADRFEELIWPALDVAVSWTISEAFQAYPYMDDTFKERLRDYAIKYREEIDELSRENPFGLTLSTRSWAGNNAIINRANTNYMAYKAFPDIFDREDVFSGLNYLFGCRPYSNISFVSAVGTRSKKVAYGMNRADFSFIAGGVVPGLLILSPDFPENKEDWPFLWGENEYVIDIGAAYIFLAKAAHELTREFELRNGQ
jgi:endoglucanase